MILTVDPRHPEISLVLAQWMRLRQRRSDLAQQAIDGEISNSEFVAAADDINRDLTDLADELVDFLAPTPADRAFHCAVNRGLSGVGEPRRSQPAAQPATQLAAG